MDGNSSILGAATPTGSILDGWVVRWKEALEFEDHKISQNPVPNGNFTIIVILLL